MNMRKLLSLTGAVVGTAVVAALTVTPTAHAAQPLHGSAFGVSAEVKFGQDQTLVALPPLANAEYTPGGEGSFIELDSEEILGESKGLLSARALNASANATEGTLTSKASVAELRLGLDSPKELKKLQGALALSADVVTAECSLGPDGITAESVLADVKLAAFGLVDKKLVGGSTEAVVHNVAPNTTVELPGVGKVVLNEQIESAHSVTVNAIHIYLDPALKLLYGDIIVSQATCYTDAKASPQPTISDSPGPEPSDTVTPSEPADGTPTETTPGPGGSAGGDLPVTGTSLGLIAGLGAALLAAGAAAIWLTRRRKADTTAEASDS